MCGREYFYHKIDMSLFEAKLGTVSPIQPCDFIEELTSFETNKILEWFQNNEISLGKLSLFSFYSPAATAMLMVKKRTKKVGEMRLPWFCLFCITVNFSLIFSPLNIITNTNDTLWLRGCTDWKISICQSSVCCIDWKNGQCTTNPVILDLLSTVLLSHKVGKLGISK